MSDYFSEAVRKVNEVYDDEYKVWLTYTTADEKLATYKDFCHKAC
jgi:hypothetical protein